MTDNLNRVTAVPIPEVKPINSTLAKRSDVVASANKPAVTTLPLVNPPVRNNIIATESRVQSNVKAIAAGVKAFNFSASVGDAVTLVKSSIGATEALLSKKVFGAGAALGGVHLVSPLTSLFNQELVDLKQKDNQQIGKLGKAVGINLISETEALNKVPKKSQEEERAAGGPVEKASNTALNKVPKKSQEEERAAGGPVEKASNTALNQINKFSGFVTLNTGLSVIGQLEMLRRYKFLVIDSSPDNFTVFDDKIKDDAIVGLFATCDSPSYEFGLEVIKEGTWEFPRKIMTSVTTGNLVLKKGMFKTQTSLWRWVTSAIRGGITRRDITIHTLLKPPIVQDNGINLSVAKYTLFNCIPSGYNHEGWDAFSPDVQLYSLGISYEYFEEEAGIMVVTPNNIVESEVELV